MPKAAKQLRTHRPVAQAERKRPDHYGMYRKHKWHKASRAYRKEHPYCELCGGPSESVDHIVPHQGDYDLFWDESNWQALCLRCHGRKDGKRRGSSPA